MNKLGFFKLDPENLGVECKPLGWSKSENADLWRIFHKCGNDPMKWTQVRMERVNGGWLIVYDPSGKFQSEDADPNADFALFESAS